MNLVNISKLSIPFKGDYVEDLNSR